ERIARQQDRPATVDSNSAAMAECVTDHIARDDVAKQRRLSVFQFDAAATTPVGHPIILDADVLDARRATLHPDSAAEQVAHVAGDRVIADQRVAIVGTDAPAVVAATAAGDGEAVERGREPPTRAVDIYH